MQTENKNNEREIERESEWVKPNRKEPNWVKARTTSKSQNEKEWKRFCNPSHFHYIEYGIMHFLCAKRLDCCFMSLLCCHHHYHTQHYLFSVFSYAFHYRNFCVKYYIFQICANILILPDVPWLVFCDYVFILLKI